MNTPEMVVLIVAIVSIASIVRAKYGIVRRHRGEDIVRPADDSESRCLRDELRTLKERVAVLERIGVGAADRALILGGNLDRLLPLPPRTLTA